MRDWISIADLSTRLAAVITADRSSSSVAVTNAAAREVCPLGANRRPVSGGSDHLVVGDGNYFSFREAGALGGAPGKGLR